MSGRFDQTIGPFTGSSNPFAVDETPSTAFLPGELGHVYPVLDATAVDIGIAPKLIQKIQRYATDTVAVVAGDLAFWQDTDNCVVTGEPANAVGGTTAPIPAGVFGAATPAAGNYGYIQVGGIAPVRVSDSTSAGTIGYTLVWSTNRQVKHVVSGTQTNQNFLPVVGVLRTLNTATTTNLSVEALLTVPRLSW